MNVGHPSLLGLQGPEENGEKNFVQMQTFIDRLKY